MEKRKNQNKKVMHVLEFDFDRTIKSSASDAVAQVFPANAKLISLRFPEAICTKYNAARSHRAPMEVGKYFILKMGGVSMLSLTPSLRGWVVIKESDKCIINECAHLKKFPIVYDYPELNELTVGDYSTLFTPYNSTEEMNTLLKMTLTEKPVYRVLHDMILSSGGTAKVKFGAVVGRTDVSIDSSVLSLSTDSFPKMNLSEAHDFIHAVSKLGLTYAG